MRSVARSQHLASSLKQLAQVAAATLAVAGCPVAIVWWLRASGTVSSAVFGVILGMALSLSASYLGRLVWETRSGSEDLLFSELMIWGYLHRCYSQRRLASALDMVGPMNETQRQALDGLSPKDQAKLLERLVAGIETRDRYLHGHSRRVARHAWMIARRMGLPRAEVARIRTAAAIHDVGKINTPKAILHKTGPLTDEEYEIIKQHPGDGAQMAAMLRDPELTSMVAHHHERLDASGYPEALAGKEIPLGARIIAVADTFDAITSTRPYRPASPHKQAIDILKAEAGTRLDPAVVRAFCGHYAGRAPIALWSSLACLPERVLAWLGASATTVASAAKVVTVAALVGGAAVTSSTLGLPAAVGRHPSKTRQDAPTGSHTQISDSTHARASVLANAPATPRPRQSAHVRHPAATPAARDGVRRVPGTPTQGGAVAGISSQGAAPGGGENVTTRKSEEVDVRGEGSPSKGKLETPSKGRPESPGTSEESHSENEEAPGQEEAHSKEEASGKGQPESPGKSEESHGKSEEGHGREEAHAKEEAHRKEETSGKGQPESPGKSEESRGKSEESRGKSEESRGKSEGADGQEDAHDNSAVAQSPRPEPGG